MRTKRIWALLGLAAGTLASSLPASAQMQNDYWWTRETVIIPHVSGDKNFSNTYENWNDEDAVRRSKAKGLASRDINFKDFRWLEKSFDAMAAVDEGKETFHRKNAKGESCASCHGTDGEKLRGAYAKLPKYNQSAGRVVSGPTQIRICAEERLGQPWKENTRQNSVLDMYVAWLSDGATVDIDVTSASPLKESYERGKDLYFKRTGQFHFACASCHTGTTTSLYIRGQRPSTPFGDAAHYPIWHFGFALPGDDTASIFTMQHQIKSCQTLSRMHQGTEGSISMTDIEVFLKALANGYKMSIPTVEYNMSTDYLLSGRN